MTPCALFRPSFPAATTTTIPAFQAASTAWHRGSTFQLSYTGLPRERFITRMLYCDLSLFASWIPAITVLSVPRPFSSSTRRLTKFTLGAIPRKVWKYVDPLELAPLPPMIPQPLARGRNDRLYRRRRSRGGKQPAGLPSSFSGRD